MQSHSIGFPVNLEEASMFISHAVIAATGVGYVVKFTVGTGTKQSKLVILKAWSIILVATMLLFLTQAAMISLQRDAVEEEED